MLINFSKNKIKFIASLTIAGVLCSLFYLTKNYKTSNKAFKEISFETQTNPENFLIYYNPESDYKTDFSKPIKPVLKENKLTFNLPTNGWRNIRIYISGPLKNVSIKNLSSEKGSLSLDEMSFSGLKPIVSKLNNGIFNVETENAYFEFKKKTLSQFDFWFSLSISFLASFIISCVFYFFLRKEEIDLNLKSKDIFLYSFLFSIFLPLPIFNIFFIFFIAANLFRIKFNTILYSPPSLIFILYFIYAFLNNAFIANNYTGSIIETLTPFILLPIAITAINQSKYLVSFVYSSVFIGLYFLITSLIDFSITGNLDFFSFDAFTKYLHPVYFSYAIFFSIVYVLSSALSNSHKLLINSFLFLLLLFCGSKLILFLSTAFMIIYFIRKGNKIWMYAFLLPLVLVFKPFRERLFNIINVDSLSILKEQKINDQTDVRLNGATLRIILWQESINSIDEPKEILLGKGFDQTANDELKTRLMNRGIRKHNNLDPHNQFITTFYKMGLLGLGLLVFLFTYLLKVSLSQKNLVLFSTTIMFICAAFFESYLQRVVGIYFFTSIILLLALQKNKSIALN
jgi:O-antigen ligase